MVTTLDASTLSLNDVHRLLKLDKQVNSSLESLLALESLTEEEQKQLKKIRTNFESYYGDGKILEGQIQFLFLSPLLWLAGFHSPRIKITLEVGIEQIVIEDRDTVIRGRMDVLAAQRNQEDEAINTFWVLLIESKNSSVDASEGLPQLLSYAYRGLDQQPGVWGMTTNGMDYQLVYLEQGPQPTYQLFPKLSLLYPDQSQQLLQAMKTICQVYVKK